LFQKKHLLLPLAGFLAGCVNGLLGAGGGMILVPLLCLSHQLREEALFPASVCIIAPICILSLILYSRHLPIPWYTALPYLLGSAGGGILAGIYGRRIPVKWLHKVLGVLILWGGIRYLC